MYAKNDGAALSSKANWCHILKDIFARVERAQPVTAATKMPHNRTADIWSLFLLLLASCRHTADAGRYKLSIRNNKPK